MAGLGGTARGISVQKGFDTLYPSEIDVLWGLAGNGHRYLLPLTATCSMRMQSNFHRKWLLHLNPSWSP